MHPKVRLGLLAAAIIAFVLLVIGLVGRPLSTGPDPSGFAVAAMRALGVPGVSAAYIREDGTVSRHAAGMAADGRFLIASVSKTMTALAVMQLVEAGRLELVSRVGDLLPVPVDQGAGQVTVRQLLAHASGISNSAGLVFTTRELRADGFRVLRELELTASPGDKLIYSNLNYRILGIMVEEISGLPLSRYLHREVFAPLGMDRTDTARDLHGLGEVVPGHTQILGLNVPVSWTKGLSEVASGGVISTREDLVRYLRALVWTYGASRGSPAEAGRSGGVRPADVRPADVQSAGARSVGLDSTTIARMWSAESGDPAGEAWGLGWQVTRLPEGRVVVHSGDLPGYQALVAVAPDRGTGLVMLANADTLPLAFAGEIVQRFLQAWTAAGEPPSAAVRLPRLRLALRGLFGLLLVFLVRDVIRITLLISGRARRRGRAAFALALVGSIVPAAAGAVLAVQGILDDALLMFPDGVGFLGLFALLGLVRGGLMVARRVPRPAGSR